MADIETSVVISAQIDGLRSGMEAAANSVQTATEAMRTQLAGLGDIAQQAQSQLTAATGQIGTGIGAMQSRTVDLAGSIGAGMMPSSGSGDAGASGSVQTGSLLGSQQDASSDEKLWDEELQAYQKFQSDKEKLDLQALQTSQRTWQSLMQPIQRAFDTSITGMILGTTTLQKAVANIAQSILAEFVNLGVKMVTNWLPGGGFLEPITAPNVVSAIYLNGITQAPATYSVDPATGLVRFVTAPSNGLIIAADFTYYFRCRFIDDKYDFENFMDHLWQLKKLTFISVR